jgi:hypothetical protein
VQRYNNSTLESKKTLNSNPVAGKKCACGCELGNSASYSAKSKKQKVKKAELSDAELATLKYDYKKHKVELKKRIGKKVLRVSYCGTRTIAKDSKYINAVRGESGSIYYQNMQHCGSVWFCPDCAYKLMKARADELYNQLKFYKADNKKIMFVTFTEQHHNGDRLAELHKILLDAFNFANTHRKWQDIKKRLPIEYLRALEVLYGVNGWHPHLHCVFIGDPEIVNDIKVFTDLYKEYLAGKGLLINEHTVDVEQWNGKLEDLEKYMFKDMLEHELTSGGLKKSGHGKTFYELIDEGTNEAAIDEYIQVMKGKRQYHHSKGFFKDVRVKDDVAILKDDTIAEVLFRIPKYTYADINSKGIALHLLNEYEYGGIPRAIRLLELYDCDTTFFDDTGAEPVPEPPISNMNL